MTILYEISISARCDNAFIQQICKIFGTQHGNPDNPTMPFRALYDSDKLAIFSPEEFLHYNSPASFNWEKLWIWYILNIYGGWQRDFWNKERTKKANLKP